ncbi:hypothetical protein TNCV_3226601 [Trichonephila clavipes]|nr:hypothetical protein TNCV_3226601 [Trichonephila clavipes]
MVIDHNQKGTKDLGYLHFHSFSKTASLQTQQLQNNLRGRSKLRWADCVKDDFEVLRVINWRTVAKRRSERKEILVKSSKQVDY